MYNPFDLIPHTIDKNLRDIIITLIIIQFSAFLILISYLTYEYICYKLDSGRSNKLEKEEDNKGIKFDNEDEVKNDSGNLLENEQENNNHLKKD
jgi:hypothetical protein